MRGDLAARALRAIADGAVDDGGVAGLAARLHVSERHLHRVLVTEIGASPLQLARTRRAQLARLLIDETPLRMTDVAFAAGFASVRQFNDVMRAEFGAPPSALRRPAGAPPRPAGATPRRDEADPGEERAPVDAAALALRLRYAGPFDPGAWLAHVTHRAVAGLERADAASITRLLTTPAGPAVVTVVPGASGDAVLARLQLPRLADLGGVVARLRRWLDLDADPAAVDAALGADPVLGPLVAARPGLRIPGTVDPVELAVRAVLGQQVSTAGARTLTGRLVAELGAPGPDGLSLFPTPEAIVDAGEGRLRALGLTGARARTLVGLAGAVVGGLALGPGADRAGARAALLAVPGIGPWTADYVALRALGDPDVFPAGDLVLRRALAELPGGVGGPVDVAAAAAHAQQWRPWRGYAAQHLWTAWADRARPRAAQAALGPRPAWDAAPRRPGAHETIVPAS